MLNPQLLDASLRLALDELVELSGLARDDLTALVEFGVFQPADEEPSDWRFPAAILPRARQAARLQRDFGLDAAGLALALAYLERIDALERRVRELECALPR